MYSYAIEARPAELGGGWRLRLFEGDQEVGGGVFPLDEYLPTDAGLIDAAAREMADIDAYHDALARGEAWLESRGVF